MIKEISDISIINKFLEKFNVSINDIGVFSHYCLYTDGDEIMGFLNYDLIYDRIEIAYIYIEEKYRKKGFASNLIEYLIDIAKEKKCSNISLEVNENNTSAINLYIKNGFIEVAKREKYYNGEDGILMVRELG